MGQTAIEKILAAHSHETVRPGAIVDVTIDVRVARDFGGANVVKNLVENGLGVADPSRSFFTFDCNPTGSDQKYAANQQACRLFAREHGVKVYDIDAGIGTHLVMDQGLVGPGDTFVSTDSHANILGAIGAFGQGMGDQDVAHAFAYGRVWFRVPPSKKIVLEGRPHGSATAKDVTLFLAGQLGAAGLLGFAAEVTGDWVEGLDLAQRVTMASMATEMGAIILLFPPSDEICAEWEALSGRKIDPLRADADARYEEVLRFDIEGLRPQVARPGKPDDAVALAEVAGTKIDSAFIGSCTNGRFEDLAEAAEVLRGRKVAPGVVLKIVPATDAVWKRALEAGLLEVFKAAGALVGNAGCAGCAAGQIGQNGPGEVTVSTGNRNFPGKQGRGKVWLASPATVAASAVAGVLASADAIPDAAVSFPAPSVGAFHGEAEGETLSKGEKSTSIRGRVWVVDKDSIDTDMIYHNRYLTVTDLAEMGQYSFDNLPGWEDFAKKVRPGDIVVTGENFGCGSSRQQAVDCFKALGVTLIVARSFGAIYERNAINAGLPILTADLRETGLVDGDEIEVELSTGIVRLCDEDASVKGTPFSDVQMRIYQRGGLLTASGGE